MLHIFIVLFSQFTNKVDRQLNQVKSALQQVDHDEIEQFKKEHNEEDLDDDELVNSNSPEDILGTISPYIIIVFNH